MMGIEVKDEWNIDVAVLLVFFCRDEQFTKVFEQVRIAKPRKLFLHQDGPREGRDDMNGIMNCRKIASNIDWDCELYTNYSEVNVGCDPSVFNGIKWAFSIVDKCIVLEDDCVPSISFFSFAHELLEKYEDDERINMICGMNNLEVFDEDNQDYFFSRRGSIWGWATWRRVINQWDETYDLVEDSKNFEKIGNNFDTTAEFKKFKKMCKRHKDSCKAHHESLNAISQFSNNQLNIVPCRNMISNIGIGAESTHSTNELKLVPRRVRKLFFMKKYEVNSPMRHPKHIVRNKIFDDLMYDNNCVKLCNRLESFVLKIRYGDFKQVVGVIKKRLNFK